jgi:hypothetical protein
MGDMMMKFCQVTGGVPVGCTAADMSVQQLMSCSLAAVWSGTLNRVVNGTVTSAGWYSEVTASDELASRQRCLAHRLRTAVQLPAPSEGRFLKVLVLRTYSTQLLFYDYGECIQRSPITSNTGSVSMSLVWLRYPLVPACETAVQTLH